MRPGAALAAVAFVLAVVAGLVWVAFRGERNLDAALRRCDHRYAAALIDRAPLGPVNDCYQEVFRLRPWNRQAAFRLQSIADLERERAGQAPEQGPLAALAAGDLAACDRIETDPKLQTPAVRSAWLRLCLELRQN